MRKILLGAVAMLLIVFCFRYCEFKRNSSETIIRESQIIEEALKNVGKLVVTEGEYAEFLTYEDSKKFYLDILSAKKKALVTVQAKATISYDLHLLETQIDAERKTIVITKIPEPELNIYPDITYYDVRQDLFNPFDEADYNKIKDRVSQSLNEKIRSSTLYSNAQNRLISELQKLYLLSNPMGWTLEYQSQPIKGLEAFGEFLKLKL